LYALGLSSEPPNGQPDDNVFVMPSGNLRFPGYDQWGSGFSAAVQYFQSKAGIAISEPPAYELVSMAFNNSGAGGNGCGSFRDDELNDPAWDGNFNHLAGAIIWVVERVLGSNDPNQTSAHASSVYGERSYDGNAETPFTFPDTSRQGFGLEHILSLWDGINNVPRVAQGIGAWGQEEKLLYAVSNGANAQWITHWDNEAATEAAGDGPGWFVDRGANSFGHLNIGAILQAYQRGAVSSAAAWGWRLFATDGTTVQMPLDINTDQATFDVPIVTPPLSTPSGESLTESFSLDIDTTSSSADKGIIVPARPGQSFLISRISGTVISKTGGVVTVSPSFNIGSIGATYVDWSTGVSLLSTAGINTGPGASGSVNSAGTNAAQSNNAAIHIGVVTPQSGATTLVVRVVLIGYWLTL
jgi:hypothetical protein